MDSYDMKTLRLWIEFGHHPIASKRYSALLKEQKALLKKWFHAQTKEQQNEWLKMIAQAWRTKEDDIALSPLYRQTITAMCQMSELFDCPGAWRRGIDNLIFNVGMHLYVYFYDLCVARDMLPVDFYPDRKYRGFKDDDVG
jgi:hypothetical protein